MTISEASACYGVSTSWIRTLVQDGRVEGKLYGKTWLIQPASLDRYLTQRRRPGRPRR
jgi:excisionase family DNA binding protein